ncbi:hypothetical protein KJ633_08955, partial [bacterium]|nr:hypothetical protein [bacterium]MBU3956574.1 hypothetical protein [bacterium]
MITKKINLTTTGMAVRFLRKSLKFMFLYLFIAVVSGEVCLLSAADWTINYQGHLKKSGVPVDATKPMIFKIKAADEDGDGSKVWTSGVKNVVVTKGYFSFYLGADNTADFQLINWDEPKFIEVTVDGVILSPREKFAGSAFSYNSARLSGKTHSDLSGEYVNAEGDTLTGSMDFSKNEALNFVVQSSVTQPSEAVLGQIWFDTGNNEFKIYYDDQWNAIRGVTKFSELTDKNNIKGMGIGAEPVPITPASGRIYYDSVNNLLKYYNGIDWIAVTEGRKNFSELDDYQSGEVGKDSIADGAVIRDKIADYAISSIKITTGAVTTTHIQDGTIMAADINAAAAIAKTQISSEGTWAAAEIPELNASIITEGEFATNRIADSAVTGAKIKDFTITSVDIDTSAVTTTKILDGTITDIDVSATAAIAPTKVKIFGTTTLDDWRSQALGYEAWIDGSKIVGEMAPGAHKATHQYGGTDALSLDRRQIVGKAIVESTNTYQEIKPDADVVALKIYVQGGAGTTSNSLEIYSRDWSNNKAAFFDKNGILYLSELRMEGTEIAPVLIKGKYIDFATTVTTGVVRLANNNEVSATAAVRANDSRLAAMGNAIVNNPDINQIIQASVDNRVPLIIKPQSGHLVDVAQIWRGQDGIGSGELALAWTFTNKGHLVPAAGMTVDGVDLSTWADAEYIKGSMIKEGSLTTTQIQDRGITGTDIMYSTILSTNIKVGGVESINIKDGTITVDDISPNVVSSVDGVSNDGGNIDFIAGTNITITPDDGANTITIDAVGSGDITAVYAGEGLKATGSE